MSTRTPVSPEVIEQLRAVVGAGGAITEQADLRPHLREWRDRFFGRTPLMLQPSSTEEVARIVKICHETQTPIVPQGGNTSLCGGSVPHEDGSEVIVHLGRMNRIRSLDPLNYTMSVEAGCILADVQAAAAANDRLFPLSLAAEGTCQIGGNLSTNAGGNAVLRFGTARDLVLGLEVVLPDGRIWDGMRGLRKDNTGYDLKNLFLGAEGTLGIITAAVLKLFPPFRQVETAFIAVPGVAAAVELLALARSQSGDAVTAFELMNRVGLDYVLDHIERTVDPLPKRHDWYLLCELSATRPGDGLRESLEELLASANDRGLAEDAAIARSRAQARALWRLRESFSEAQKHEGGSIKHDVSVPISRIADFITEASAAVQEAIPGTRIVAFGHIGDGNVHFNPSQPPAMEKEAFLGEWERVNRLVHDLASKLGGSISAEHGIGRLKRDELRRYKSKVELDLMRALKRTLDPSDIMNPGKVV